MDKDSLDKIIQLIDQPKVNFNSLEDFNIIPLCSFGQNKLELCSLFERSTNYLDHTCYTFDKGFKTKQYPSNGLHLVINTKQLLMEDNKETDMSRLEMLSSREIHLCEGLLSVFLKPGPLEVLLQRRTESRLGGKTHVMTQHSPLT